MLSAAVVGCGAISVVHLDAIHLLPDCELSAVCDIDTDAATAASVRFGVPGFADHRAMLATVSPDVVHVCTPHDQHLPVVLDCLAAGAHVIVEKPLAATAEDAERLVRAAAEHPDVKVGVCFQNRYNRAAQRVRTLLADGSLGAVRGASATLLWHRTPAYYQARPWRGQRARSGGGVLINQAIHTLDLLQWLLGEVVDVSGHVGRYGLDDRFDVEDTATLLLTHDGGVRSVFFATNTYAVDSPVTLEVITEQATLRVSGDLTISYADGRSEVVAERQATTTGRSYWGASHDLLFADFYRRLGDPEPFWLSPEEAMKSQRILQAVYSGPQPSSPKASLPRRSGSPPPPARPGRSR